MRTYFRTMTSKRSRNNYISQVKIITQESMRKLCLPLSILLLGRLNLGFQSFIKLVRLHSTRKWLELIRIDISGTSLKCSLKLLLVLFFQRHHYKVHQFLRMDPLLRFLIGLKKLSKHKAVKLNKNLIQPSIFLRNLDIQWGWQRILSMVGTSNKSSSSSNRWNHIKSSSSIMRPKGRHWTSRKSKTTTEAGAALVNRTRARCQDMPSRVTLISHRLPCRRGI